MPKQKRPSEQASKEVKAIKDANDYLDWVATLKRPPMSDDELARWLGIAVEQISAWKSSACERELGKANALARAWRAKAETGNAKAIAMVQRLNERIDAMTRMRKHWAHVARRQTG